jgi:hypothetical protein
MSVKDISRVSTVTALLFCVFLGLYYALRTAPFEPVILSEDGCTYVLLARSILEGHGLASLWVTGAPAHAKAPFGFPLFLAPFLAWRGLDTGILTYAMTAMSAAALAAVFLLFRRAAGAGLALALVLLTALNSGVYLYGRSILSEIPYLFWSMLALWILDKRQGLGAAGRGGTIVVLVLLAAFFTRTAGIFLALAALVYMIADRNPALTVRELLRRYGVLALCFLVPVVWWFSRQALLTSGTQVSYVKDFVGGNYNEPFSAAGFALRILKGSYALVFYAIPKVVTNLDVGARSYVMAGVSAVMLGGLGWSLVRQRRVMDIYTIMYLAFAACWPWVQVSGVRYMVPLAPLLIYYFYTGLSRGIAFVVREPSMGFIRGVILFALAAVYIGNSPVLRPAHARSAVDATPATYDWIRKNTPPEALFVSWTPISLYVYAGRQSPDFASSTFSAAAFEQLILSGQADYIFSDMSMEQAARIFAPVYAKHFRRFHLVYNINGHRIYRIRSGGQGGYSRGGRS